MSKNLVIVESPAKARTLSKILGRSYSLKASLGHVRDLPRSGLGVDIEKGFVPKSYDATKSFSDQPFYTMDPQSLVRDEEKGTLFLRYPD